MAARGTGTGLHALPPAVITPRPGTVAEVIDVDLPVERDYGRTISEPEFARATGRIRDLPGATTTAE